MAKYIELNKLLLEKVIFKSINEADLSVRLGKVYVNGVKVFKPNMKVKYTDSVELKEKCPYVSRGGLKLEKALTDFRISVEGKVCLDIGASKGGFTDCLLQSGAKKVYALEKGKNYLSMKLREDERVEDLGGVDYTELKSLELPKFDIIVVDVSFVSLKQIIPMLKPHCKKSTKLITLIKPRYEVKNPELRNNAEFYTGIINGLLESVEGWGLKDVTNSPILGKRRGAVEFLGLFEMGGPGKISPQKIECAVKSGLNLKN